MKANKNKSQLKLTNKKMLLILILICIINNSLAEFYLYRNSGTQENVSIAPMKNGDFAVFYNCLGYYSLTYTSICYSVRGQDSPYTEVKNSYYGPDSNANLLLPSADTLTDGKIALAYQKETSAAILCVFNADFTVAVSDHKFTALDGTSTNSVVLALKNQKFLLLWKQKQADGNSRIYGNIYSNSLTKLKSEFLINDYIAQQGEHSACALDNGDFVAVWAASGQDGYANFSVFMQIFKENGSKSGSVINITQAAPEKDDRLPHVACLSNGNIAVSWTNKDGKDGDLDGVFVRLFSSAGAPLANENRVNSYTTGSQASPRVVALLEGRFAVAFQGDGPSSGDKFDGNSSGVYVQLFKDVGTAYHNNFLVNDSIVYNQRNVDIKRLQNGSYLVAWDTHDHGFAPNVTRAYFNYIAFDNLVNYFQVNDQSKPQIAALTSGGYAIVWQSFNNVSSTSDFDIYLNLYAKEKRFEVKPGINVNSAFTSGAQDIPMISAFPGGNFVVIWRSDDCANKRLYGAIFTDDLVKNLEKPLTPCAEPYGLIDYPNVLALPDNRFVLSWSQSGAAADVESDVYFQVFNAADFTTSVSMTKLNPGNTPSVQKRSAFAYVTVNTKTSIAAVYDSGTATGAFVAGNIFKSDFTVSKQDFTISVSLTGNQNYPFIKGLADGNFVVGYRSSTIDANGLGVAAKIISTSGADVVTEKCINTFKTGNQILTGLDASDTHIYFYWTGQNNLETSGVGLTKTDLTLTSAWEREPMRFKINGQQNGGVAVLDSKQVVLAIESDSGDIEGKSVLYEILEVCPDNYFNNSNTNFMCLPCDASCVGCTTEADLCVACKAGFYRKVVDDGKCYAWTPSTDYYFDTTNNKWASCDASCSGCITSAKNCLACAATYFPQSTDASKCFLSTAAPDGFFWDVALSKHFPCNAQCAKCVTTANTCTLCKAGYYPLVDAASDCRTTAPNGYYLNSTTNKHEFCDLSCVTCVDSATKCLVCKTGYYFLEDKPNCFNTEQTGYFLSVDKYLKCDISCFTCSNLRLFCTKCSTNYFPVETKQDDCRNSVNYPAGTYLESTVNMYRTCDVSCSTCVDAPKKCTKCFTDYLILEDKINTCIIKNTDLYYFSTDFNKGYYMDNPITKYLQCDVSCLKCVSSAKNCITCNNALNYFPLRDKPNTCVNAAPIGYYFDEATKYYEFCDVSCYTCVTSPANCTKCNLAQLYYKLDDKPNTCKNAPPDGYYFEVAVQWYKLCDKSCFTCIDKPEKCTKCAASYYFLEDVPNTCLNFALPNYYLEKLVNPFLYKRCAISCELCIDRAEKCTKCNYEKIYFPLETDSFSCFKDSPDYFWKNFVKKECTLCHVSCKKCSDSTPSCIVCADNYFPASDRPSACYNKAPDETYTYDSLIKNWYKCPPPGYICDEDKSFRICLDGFYLLPTTKECVKTCPDGFWADKPAKICRLCVAPCQKCVNNRTCLSCIRDYYVMEEYAENNCLEKCPLSYYADRLTGACQKCNAACASCESDKICNSCNKGFFFYRENRECVSKCPTGFFLPEASEMCSKCSAVCRSCVLKNENCTSCNYGRFFDFKSKTCVFKCPDGFYAESSTYTCNACHKSCLTCKGALESDCLSCDLKTGVRFIKGYCSDKCTGGLIKKKNSDDCIDFNECTESLIFNVPKIFNIQINNYKASIVFKLKDNCSEYANDIVINWLLAPDMIVSKDSFNVEIPVEKLKDGNLLINAEMSYNNSVIRSFTGNSILITNKLIPLIKNEAKLEFIYGFEIAIDASLSYDEGSLRTNTKETENPLLFSWACPEEIAPLCKSTNSILTFIPTEYQTLIPSSNENRNIEITLNLKKDRRTATKTFSITIRKLQIKNESGKSNEINLADLLVINPSSRGASPELIIAVFFLDKDLNVLDYKYFWTITHFIRESQYINTRKEINLKVLNDDLLTGINEFTIEVTDKLGKTYTKSYLYEKGRAPYGGNCLVSPNSGILMKTEFKFTITGWTTKSEPLIYKIKYLNNDKNYIDISKGGFAQSSWKTNLIPVADNFVVEVSDSSGLSAIAPCSLKVKANPDLELLDNYLEKDFDPVNRLLLVEIFKSNKNTAAHKQQDKDPTINDKALDMIGYYLSTAGENIQQDIENIIARLLEISNQAFTKEKLEIVNETIAAIVENIEPLLQYFEKMQNVYRILDNIFKKASNTEELMGDKILLQKMQGFLDVLDEKLFSNIVNGQALLIQNENYNTQMNKVSTLNVVELAISYESEAENKINKRSKIRRLNNNNNNDNKNSASKDNTNSCDESAAICIPKNNLNSIMSNSTANGVGFQGQLNHKMNLPIDEKQFSNSLNFGLSGEDKQGKLRRLSFEYLHVNFEIRLKMPVVKESSVVGEATCVQYSQKNADTSCESWYDLDTNEVVCSCLKQGLTVNVLDKALSNASKLKQFPTLSSDIFNPYSVSIVSVLILIFIVFFFIAIHKDKKDNLSLISMRSSNYDIIQHYIVIFRKEHFEKKLKFFKLFFYLIKNLHPIVAILNIYDPIYNRKLRVMDFFLMIYLTFFFTLLPFYATDNNQLIELAANRSIQNRNKKINDLEASIKQIFQSMIYSIIASIITFVITGLVGLFFKQDVLLEESIKKRKNMINAIIRMNPSLKALYQVKIKFGYTKIKSVVLLSRRYLKRIRVEELKKFNDTNFNNLKLPALNDKFLKIECMDTIEKAIGQKKNFQKNNKVEKTNDKSDSNLINSTLMLNSNNKANFLELNGRNILMDINKTNQKKVLKEEIFPLSSDYEIDLNLFNENHIMQLNKENEDGNCNLKKEARKIDVKENNIDSYQDKENDKVVKVVEKNKPAKKLLRNASNNIGYAKVKKTSNFIRSNQYKKKSIAALEKELFKSPSDKTNNRDISTYFNYTKNDSMSTRIMLNENEKAENKPKVYNDENANLTEESFALSLIGKKEFINKPKKKIISVCTRTFIFPTKNSSIFHCQKISIADISKIDNALIFIKSIIKITIVLTMYLFLWFYIAIFVQSIYKQYGNNVFKICVMPLISMLFVNLVFVVNFMLLLATVLLYNKGKDFVNSSKQNGFWKLLFKIFVPPVAMNHFVAIITFIDVERISV